MVTDSSASGADGVAIQTSQPRHKQTSTRTFIDTPEEILALSEGLGAADRGKGLDDFFESAADNSERFDDRTTSFYRRVHN